MNNYDPDIEITPLSELKDAKYKDTRTYLFCKYYLDNEIANLVNSKLRIQNLNNEVRPGWCIPERLKTGYGWWLPDAAVGGNNLENPKVIASAQKILSPNLEKLLDITIHSLYAERSNLEYEYLSQTGRFSINKN